MGSLDSAIASQSHVGGGRGGSAVRGYCTCIHDVCTVDGGTKRKSGSAQLGGMVNNIIGKKSTFSVAMGRHTKVTLQGLYILKMLLSVL